MVGKSWTLDDEAKCRHMKRDGKTAEQMATELGRTRNSVLGFMNRKDITGQPKSKNMHLYAVKRVIQKQREERQRFKEIMKNTGVNLAVNKHPEFNRTDGIPLGDLIENQCRWPVTPDKPFRFCADATDGRQYCDLHHDTAHNNSCRKNKG